MMANERAVGWRGIFGHTAPSCLIYSIHLCSSSPLSVLPHFCARYSLYIHEGRVLASLFPVRDHPLTTPHSRNALCPCSSRLSYLQIPSFDRYAQPVLVTRLFLLSGRRLCIAVRLTTCTSALLFLHVRVPFATARPCRDRDDKEPSIT
jgi:hypothetical protein